MALMTRIRSLTLAGLLVAATAPSLLAQAADTIALRRTLDSLVQGHRGVVGYAVHNLDTGERLTHRAHETFATASLIKVPILVTLYDLVEQGQLSLDDPLTVLRIDQVPGAGVLQHMRPGLTLTVRDAAVLMIVLSDNTATNLILDRIAIRRVWQKMEALGLMNTKVHSKVFLRLASVAPDSSVKYGLGVTTPDEMVRLFAMLAEGRAVNPRADSAMLAILRHTSDASKMQRFAGGVAASFKTGDTDSVRTECALFRLPARVVACGLTKANQDTRYTIDAEGNVVLARLGEAVVNAWRRRPSGR